ncbi:MAG: hypothetical protein PHN56_02320 [Candidatus Nanoarchaeia archaeon]|nr:hypothetical protein [Candidatus Nanoarchaeia archaeon]
MNKNYFLLLSLIFLAGCTSSSIYTNWTECENNIQFRNVTNYGLITVENRSCAELTSDDIILGLADLPVGYMLINSSSESSELSYLVGTINGVNYTMEDLGYVGSAQSEYKYESINENYGVDFIVSVYSPEGVKKRFTIMNESWYEGIPIMDDDYDIYLVSGKKLGTNSVNYAVRYNETVDGVTNEQFQYNQFFYIDKYWVNTYVWGDEGSFNPETIEELNLLALNKINVLMNNE